MTAPHDLNAPAGAPCAGCDPVDEWRGWLVTASRDLAVSVCGHYHAEHHARTMFEARALYQALAARHGAAEIAHVHQDEPHTRYHATTYAGAGPYRDPCCQPIRYGPGCCPACGDPMDRWTHPEAVA